MSTLTPKAEKPVKLVSAVVKRKSAVVPGNLCEANIPPTTIRPLAIAINVIITCGRMNAPIDIPRIMERPVIGCTPTTLCSVLQFRAYVRSE